jgi:hypothetical protein
MLVSELDLPMDFLYLINMGIRRQIKTYVFGLFDNFTQIYTNLKEDNYEKNLKNEKENQVTFLRQKRTRFGLPVSMANSNVISTNIHVPNGLPNGVSTPSGNGIKPANQPLFTTINTAKVETAASTTTLPKFDKSDNILKKYVPFMFDVKLEQALGPLTRSKRYMENNKLIKPNFLKSRSKNKKSKTNNQHILHYDHNVVIISKKVLKYYYDYDRIIIDKKVLQENPHKSY